MCDDLKSTDSLGKQFMCCWFVISSFSDFRNIYFNFLRSEHFELTITAFDIFIKKKYQHETSATVILNSNRLLD